ncbi:hypothetical protein Ndes2526B_g05401 [Nannochloris sp. 'desiccata']
MARRGVWQLQKLIINYCDISGSSSGTREFMKSWLPRFREENPQLEIVEVLKRGGHPFLDASFRNGNTRMVTLRNHLPEEILRQAAYLRSCAGRKTSLRVKQRTQTATPSIQGQWNAKVQDTLKN